MTYGGLGFVTVNAVVRRTWGKSRFAAVGCTMVPREANLGFSQFTVGPRPRFTDSTSISHPHVEPRRPIANNPPQPQIPNTKPSAPRLPSLPTTQCPIRGYLSLHALHPYEPQDYIALCAHFAAAKSPTQAPSRLRSVSCWAEIRQEKR